MRDQPIREQTYKRVRELQVLVSSLTKLLETQSWLMVVVGLEKAESLMIAGVCGRERSKPVFVKVEELKLLAGLVGSSWNSDIYDGSLKENKENQYLIHARFLLKQFCRQSSGFMLWLRCET